MASCPTPFGTKAGAAVDMGWLRGEALVAGTNTVALALILAPPATGVELSPANVDHLFRLTAGIVLLVAHAPSSCFPVASAVSVCPVEVPP